MLLISVAGPDVAQNNNRLNRIENWLARIDNDLEGITDFFDAFVDSDFDGFDDRSFVFFG